VKHVLMLKGLPGSGKSTLAHKIVREQPYHARVNKDDLRAMLGNYSSSKEKHILAMRDMIVEYWLEKGYTIIVDDTNFHPKHEARLRELAEKHGAGFGVNMVEATLDECIKRDLERPNSVGEKVIKKMHEDYVRPAIAVEYQKNPFLPKAIICDLDGTLALHNGRNPYDASTCDQDLVNQPVAEAICKYARDDYKVLFTSGRESVYREQTIKFLKKVNIPGYQLFMRAAGDRRKDHVVKLELFQRHIHGHYNVEAVFDDRQRVVDMWRDVGLTVFQVADGNF
jgi:predicted kinase